MNQPPDTVFLPAAELCFDVRNPRLLEFGVSGRTSPGEILNILWEAMDARELAMSIAASGFFRHEPLIVAEENGRRVVIEGNRRLAAVRGLLDPALVKRPGGPIPVLDPAARKALEHLPVLYGDRREAWRYLGFKHVNGPAKWTGFAKAQYVAQVHREYGVPLRDIAGQIGDSHGTVRRLYRGLMILEQAERAKVWDSGRRWNPRLAFSHLYTAADYDGVAAFLGLEPDAPESPEPVPPGRLKELGEFLTWLYGDRPANRPPVVISQNPHLRMLDEALKSPEAVYALRDGCDIVRAHELSRPSSALFAEALSAARRELMTAKAQLTPGYDGSEELLRIAGTVADLADSIYREMERIRNPETRPVRQTVES